MESKTNYTIVGLSVLILIIGFVGSLIWLSIGFDKIRYVTYAVYMKEAVTGLSPDAPVKFNGVKVGYVKSIRLNQNNPQQVQLLLSISDDIPITESTTATLISQGITGTTYIGLSASSSNLTPLKILPGDKYPIIPARPSLFNQLDNALKGVSENINSVTVQIKRVFDDENTANIKKTLANLRLLTDEIEKERPHLHNIITNIDTSSAQLPKFVASLNVGIDNINQNTIPAANTLFKNLNRMALNLTKTTSDLKSNPAVLIRGTAPGKPGPGE